MDNIFISEKIDRRLWDSLISAVNPVSLHIFTDSNVQPLIAGLLPWVDLSGVGMTVVEAGEGNKNIESLCRLWSGLTRDNARRRSLLVNVGGGVVTDMGGFGAATFKRGMPFINVSTTLLGAVDASAGGKTGIDFAGLKNQIGTFAAPQAVFIPVCALSTLPAQEMVSGFGEIVKTGLICSPQLYGYILEHLDDYTRHDIIECLIGRCVAFKGEVVAKDPQESGLRKILNFGHTAGHAIESLMLSRRCPVPHGVAVAHGILVALAASHRFLRLEEQIVDEYAGKVLLPRFPMAGIGRHDIAALVELMRADKKNNGGDMVSFTLLRSVGEPVADCRLDYGSIATALDIYFNYIEAR